MQIDPVATYARRTPNALACVDLATGQRWIYRDFDKVINQVANWLVAELGPASAKRVATIARNSASMLILNLACIRAGAIFVPCNWRLSTVEIAAIVDDARPAIVFPGEEFSLPETSAKLFVLSDLLALSCDHSTQAPIGARRAIADTSTLLYTSGTSGHPKGVMISEVNALWSQLAFNTGNNVGARSIFLCDMPLFHTAGLLVNTRAALLAGGAVMISAGFDVDASLARLSDPALGITHYFSVPQMAGRLWQHPQFDAKKLHNLTVYATGGAPNPKVQIEQFLGAGVPMSDGYGMTEAGSVSGIPLGNFDTVVQKAGSCGVAYLSVETRIVNTLGEDLPQGEVGELWLRGPGITSGYWNQPDKTKEAFCGEWFKTGDMARIDEDGYLFIVDRKKDMYISGGENIYPAEIESVIAEMSEVREVAVVGVVDKEWGERGIAFVVPISESTLDVKEVENYCRTKLASYKIPKNIFIRESLPYTSTGKVQKKQLREEIKLLE